MTTFSKIIGRIKSALIDIAKIKRQLDEISINQGIILSHLSSKKSAKDLKDHEFKVFSQWGEDGIIQYLTRSLEIKNKTFIEFGVEDFSESNCRFLLMKDDWQGFVIDGSESNIERLQNSYFYWKHDLTAVARFITKENINEILAISGLDNDLGILSVDLDGNDYFILEAIEGFRPRILICEYNPVFGGSRKISTPYRSDFQRTKAHFSNLYWGASLAAMTHLAKKRGYALVGTNTAGNNAFYVRNDLLNDQITPISAESAYFTSNFRESRDKEGNLSYAAGENRLALIKGLPVFEVEKQALELL